MGEVIRGSDLGGVVDAGTVDEVVPAVENQVPYRGHWTLAAARRYFAHVRAPRNVSVVDEREEGVVRWRDVTFSSGAGIEGMATMALPVAVPITRGGCLGA